MSIDRTLTGLALGLALSPLTALAAVHIPVDEDVMTSSFFQGSNAVRGYPGDSRPVMRVSTDGAFGNAGAETIYLTFNYDFSTFTGPVSATLTMQSVDGGFSSSGAATPSLATPFLVSAHGVSADPLTSITDNTNPSGPIHWLTFYNSNILAADSAASTSVNCLDCAVTFDVSALVNSWISGANSIQTIALTGKNDTSGNPFLHGFLNNNDTGTDLGHTYLTVAAVPEPETYAMLLAGLGVTGWVARRRRRG